MDNQIGRRDFLKATPAAAALAYAIQSPAQQARQQKPADPRVNVQARLPAGRRLPHPREAVLRCQADGRLLGAEDQDERRGHDSVPGGKPESDGRGLSGNVLEAAIYSLQTHPDPRCRRRSMCACVHGTGSPRSPPERPGNGRLRGGRAPTTCHGQTRSARQRHPRRRTRSTRTSRPDNPPFSGGERDAINCVQLYRVTRDKKHLDLAKHYLDIRGLENSVNRSRHNQSYKPVLEQSEAVGHAVNCVSLMVSLADVGRPDRPQGPYLRRGAAHVGSTPVRSKMYVTGGVGTTGNEGFGEPYVLPNISAYSETCAVLMFIDAQSPAVPGHRRQQVHRRAWNAAMYNNAIDGVSATGNRFFYVNRLASAGDGRDLRWERASLECCPPNLVRFLASMPGYIYAQDQDRRDLREPVRVERDVLQGRGQESRPGRRERDAVGRQVDHRAHGRAPDARRDQAADPGVGAQSTGAGQALLIHRQS